MNRILKNLALLTWFGFGIFILMNLGALHGVAWNPQRVDLNLKSQWKLTHLVSEDCGCSKLVLKSLAARSPNSKYEEEIIILSKNKTSSFQKLGDKGYTIRVITQDAIEQQFQDAGGVPTLYITNPKNEVVYVGGYSEKRIKTIEQIEDQIIFSKVLAGEPVHPRPIFGCVVGKKLQSLADPMNFKYKKWW